MIELVILSQIPDSCQSSEFYKHAVKTENKTKARVSTLSIQAPIKLFLAKNQSNNNNYYSGDNTSMSDDNNLLS